MFLKNSNERISATINQIFKVISEFEKKAEVIKQVLNDNFEFDPNSIFSSLDEEKINKLTYKCLNNYFNINSIFCDIETIKMFISFYDIDQDGCINFNGFKNLVISQHNPGLKSILDQTTTKDNTICTIASDISHMLVKLFIIEIQFANKMIKLLKILNSEANYNVWNLFKEINYENSETITKEK